MILGIGVIYTNFSMYYGIIWIWMEEGFGKYFNMKSTNESRLNTAQNWKLPHTAQQM